MNLKIFVILSAAILPLFASCSEKKQFSGASNSADVKKEEVKEGDAERMDSTVDGAVNGTPSDNSTVDGTIGGTPDKTVEEQVLKSLPKFGMLVNHFECGFCHMKLIGDMASTSTVPGARSDSVAVVEGDWLVRGELNINDLGARINVTGNTVESYNGTAVPKSFPIIDMSAAQKKAKGSISGLDSTGKAVTIAKSVKGNTTIFGSATTPIVISGDIFIDGDLIIKGPYKGIGTIYASGSVYVPSDLKAARSIFPYPAARADAIARAEKSVAAKDTDGMGIAAGKSIFVGGLDSLDSPLFSPSDPNGYRFDYKNMYSWFGEAAYKKLFVSNATCDGEPNFSESESSMNVIDAFLYSRRGIGGFIKNSSFSFRGGMIAETFNLVNASTICLFKGGKNAIHGREVKVSYIEYDWRIYTGKFPILERLGEVLMVK